MKKTVCIMLLAFAVISCKDTLKKAQENINADSSSATKKATPEKETPKAAKTKEQIAEEAAKIWMEKIAAGEYKNTYSRATIEARYLKFDIPVQKDGVITGEYQLKRKWHEKETIFFIRYTMLAYPKFEIEIIKTMSNGVDENQSFPGKSIHYMLLFDGGKTLLETTMDPDANISNFYVATEIYKQ